MRNKARISALIVLILFIQGCYGYRIVVPESTPVADSGKKTVHSLFWGLLNDPQQIVAEECVSNSIHEVKVSTNIGYIILSAVTIGIWMPLDVEWKCGPQQSGDEDTL